MNDAQAEKEAEKVIKTVDTNENGLIDYNEFVTATIDK